MMNCEKEGWGGRDDRLREGGEEGREGEPKTLKLRGSQGSGDQHK